MIRKFLIPLLLCVFSFARAETIKTDVLVIGGGASGVAAAIQCSRSKIKTLLVEPGPWLGGSMSSGGMCVLDAGRDLPSGVWGEFRRKVTDYYRPRLGYDTAHNATLRFEPYVAAQILRKITDTVKNLTVKLSTPWKTIKKDGTGWQVTIVVNGAIVNVVAKVVIDGTETGEVAAGAGALFISDTQSSADTGKSPKHPESNASIINLKWLAILKDFGRNADKTISRPEGYDAAQFVYLKGKDLGQMLTASRVPNDKYMISWAPEIRAGGESKDELYKRAKQNVLALVYYMQTELGYKNLGLDDEFSTADHLPPAPYILESKRVRGVVQLVLDDINKPYDRDLKLYRTSIAVVGALPGEPEGKVPAFTVPLGAVVVGNLDNMLVTEKAISVSQQVSAYTTDPAVQMTLGQGVGATAAFCSFFKTTTKHLHVRIIQSEILDYKGYLMPFSDVAQKDPHWRAIQQVCVTGLLKGIQKQNEHKLEVYFEPGNVVNTEEIQPLITEIYTRGFLWFNKEKPGAQFTLANLLSLISDYTLTDPKTLQLYLQKAWAPQFKLTGTFDLSRPVTRLEFTVLVNKYLNPFAKTLDMGGRVVN